MLTESADVVLLIFCLLLSCLYSGSESALLSIPADRVNQLVAEGSRKGLALKFMTDHPSDVLTTILVGNNLVNTFIASLTTIMASKILGNDSLAMGVGVTTILILVFGEILPKTFARNHGERFAIPIIYFLKINYYLMYPVVKIFALIINAILGDNAKLITRRVTKDDIEFYVSRAEKEKTIDSKQIDLLSSILEFPKIKVKDVMVARNKVMVIDNEYTYKQIIDLIRQEAHSRYPVVNGNLDKTLGMLHIKDLFSLEKVEHFKIENYLKTPFFVYEHMKIQAVFDHMKRKKVHMALVKNEMGIVVGMITLEDIIEEILGEIQDEHDEELENIHLTSPEEGVTVQASISLRDLASDYDIKIPLSDNYSTLAGFLLDMLGNNFPKKGNIIIAEGYSFEIRKVQSNEILEVKILDVEGEKHIYNKNPEDGDDNHRKSN